MLVEDSTAFVERLEVPATGSSKLRRRIARAELEVQSGHWEVHLAASAALELERLISAEHSPRRVRILERELGSIRRHLHAKREELEVGMAHLDRLEAKARADLERRRRPVAFRLHSAGHHLDCSERRFARLSATQLQRPVFMTKKDGRVWWWYLNRCWWDNADLRPRELEDVVLRRDLERMLEADIRARARIAVLGEAAETDGVPAGPDSLHLSVWWRHRGRCVDCGSAERVNFDRIMATSRRSSDTPRNFELRCQKCRDRRDHNEGRARVSSARVNAVPYPRFG